MTKKIIDAVSLASVAVFLSVALWLAIWGEGPRMPGHWSTQSKIIVWDIAPCAFGVNWLIIRYAKAAEERFPRLRGLLFYFALILIGVALLERLFLIISKSVVG